MLESFFLQEHRTEIEAQWRQKTLVSCEILGKPAARYLRPDVSGDRTRLDLMWNGKALGVRGRTKEDGTFEFYKVERPDTVSPAILELMSIFNESKCPLKLAQIRFRAGFHGEKGLWIDAANLQIKDLLHEPSWLFYLKSLNWTIEVGQKQKEVVERNSDLVLESAQSHCWLPSFDSKNREIPVHSYVSVFSQPGPETNRALIAAGFDLLDQAGITGAQWIEWGAGYGNLSAAYASKLGNHGCASEMESAAARVLEQNSQNFFNGVRTQCWSAERGIPRNDAKKGPHLKTVSAKTASDDFDFWILDPPRPGFPLLLDKLIEKQIDESMDNSIDPPQIGRPKWILCYHCHAMGLIGDSSRLKKAGYGLRDWISVDAFPATPHHEVISLWKVK